MILKSAETGPAKEFVGQQIINEKPVNVLVPSDHADEFSIKTYNLELVAQRKPLANGKTDLRLMKTTSGKPPTHDRQLLQELIPKPGFDFLDWVERPGLKQTQTFFIKEPNVVCFYLQKRGVVFDF